MAAATASPAAVAPWRLAGGALLCPETKWIPQHLIFEPKTWKNDESNFGTTTWDHWCYPEKPDLGPIGLDRTCELLKPSQDRPGEWSLSMVFSRAVNNMGPPTVMGFVMPKTTGQILHISSLKSSSQAIQQLDSF